MTMLATVTCDRISIVALLKLTTIVLGFQIALLCLDIHQTNKLTIFIPILCIYCVCGVFIWKFLFLW